MSPRDAGGAESMDEQLSALLDGELDSAAEAGLRAEIAASPALAARLEELRAVDTALRALPEPRVASESLARLRERLAAESAPGGARRPASTLRRTPGPRRRFARVLLAGAAAAVLALLVLPRLRDTWQPEASQPDGTELVRRPGSEAPELGPRTAPTPEPSTDPTREPLPGPETERVPSQPPPAEELALALAVENEDDYEVLEMLDWLETLGEIESS